MVGKSQPDRWSRNCGSGGIGNSGQVTDYRSGVLIANWVEDDAKAFGGHSDTILTHTAPFRGPPTTTHQLLYTNSGKLGADLMEACERHDLYRIGIKGELLTRHGRFDQPPVQCLGTTYQMTHGRVDGTDRRVQSYLWHGHKQNDLYVPHSTMGPQSMGLSTRKKQDWNAQATDDPYLTTNRTTSLPPAVFTAEQTSRTHTLLPSADSGMLQHPAQRPKGGTRDECDKNYRQIGLRVNYRS
ncbi:hypothetical protein PLESTB_000557200 [Pleodorina starrii]|uniref:Uncharacterized protein n=1 Tax=Pleodorina starrii TaxID=330485 RepID=A0A9W6F096_9CHLO|nr:hypothetical protein PLESTM_000282500 [Pleodorina starrii]GLC51868.1 hypothetical protein PLESTB_000557200 [Pleodorina starrii]GLC74548.1 hypothetical protein PLESTF_001526000 [Pleodorina starrii]